MNYTTTREKIEVLDRNPNAAKIVRAIEDEVARLERVGFGGFPTMLDAIQYAANSWAILEPGMKTFRGGSHVAVHHGRERVLLIAEHRD